MILHILAVKLSVAYTFFTGKIVPFSFVNQYSYLYYGVYDEGMNPRVKTRLDILTPGPCQPYLVSTYIMNPLLYSCFTPLD